MSTQEQNSVRADQRLRGLAEAVQHWARTKPQAPACTFVDYGRERAGIPTTITYAELHARACGTAAAALEHGRPGDRAAMLLPQGLDYVTTFLGCLYAGVLAVPLYAPDLRRSNDRIIGAIADARPALTFVNGGTGPDLDGVDCGRLLPVEELVSAPAVPDGAPPAEHDALAYLQYTSGSTRHPAGVMVTRDNLAAGCAQLRNAFGLSGSATVVSWLPFFHDMGLLLGIAAPLHAGTHVVTMSPFAFVQRPVRWLRQITEHRARVTGSPNFGLDQAVLRVKPADRKDLDLSSLESMLNGAEPIRARTLDAFTETYRPHGFRASAHRPGYGLAEATLTVTATHSGAAEPVVRSFDREALATGKVVEIGNTDDSEASRLVACGAPEQQQVRIVEPATSKEAASDMVGEVWVSGPNVCAGYFERHEETAAVFEQRIAGEAAPAATPQTITISADGSPTMTGAARTRGWLRTGDLGFFHEGQLYIASRLKDLVIVNGHNHYPADLEVTVEQALPEARVGHTAAFGVDISGQERLVLVIEIDPKHTRTFDQAAGTVKVRHGLSHGHQVEAHHILFVRAGTIPKTTSGKLQRSACRRRYLDGELSPLPAAESE